MFSVMIASLDIAANGRTRVPKSHNALQLMIHLRTSFAKSSRAHCYWSDARVGSLQIKPQTDKTDGNIDKLWLNFVYFNIRFDIIQNFCSQTIKSNKSFRSIYLYFN